MDESRYDDAVSPPRQSISDDVLHPLYGVFWCQETCCLGGGKPLIYKLLQYRHKILMFRTQMDLYPGVADIGFKVNHGKCIVSKSARIGRDCVIVGDVTIGGIGGNRDHGAAIIGDRVFISTGARIIGNVKIADNVVIGANAVVVKDILEPGITVGGVPAKKISDKGSELYI